MNSARYDFGGMRNVYMSQIRNSEILKENLQTMGRPIKWIKEPRKIEMQRKRSEYSSSSPLSPALSKNLRRTESPLSPLLRKQLIAKPDPQPAPDLMKELHNDLEEFEELEPCD